MTRTEILAIAKPILFNTEMVKAILEGRKTVTRRVVKHKYSNTDLVVFTNKYGTRLIERQNDAHDPVEIIGEDGIKRTRHSLVACMECKPAYKVGDLLYVRETWTRFDCSCCEGDYCGECFNAPDDQEGCYLYHASHEINGDSRWRPSVHMPKEAARIFLRVTGVRAERLQEITEEQALQEGAQAYGQNNCSGTSARIAFAEIWDGTVKQTEYEWRANPWVLVYEFGRVEATL